MSAAYYQQGNVHISQPGAIQVPNTMPAQWAARPAPQPGVPPGLEYLSQVDKLMVKQEVNLLEAFTGWEQNNKYSIMNAQGQQVYYAFEKTETSMRVFLGPARGFTMHIVDETNQEVLRVSRQFKCGAGCCWCAGKEPLSLICDGCAHEVTIELPNGGVLGYVRQLGSCWRARYHIMDEGRNSLYMINGPSCICDGPWCPRPNEFLVNDIQTGATIGTISKEYAGFVNEFTKADNFTINFPIQTPIDVKACFLGALFLIDMMYFEQNMDTNRRNH